MNEAEASMQGKACQRQAPEREQGNAVRRGQGVHVKAPLCVGPDGQGGCGKAASFAIQTEDNPNPRPRTCKQCANTSTDAHLFKDVF